MLNIDQSCTTEGVKDICLLRRVNLGEIPPFGVLFHFQVCPAFEFDSQIYEDALHLPGQISLPVTPSMC